MKRLVEHIESLFFPSKVALIGGIILILYLSNSPRFLNNLIVFMTPFFAYVIIRRFTKDKLKTETKKFTIPGFITILLFLVMSYIFPVDMELIFGFLSFVTINSLVHFVRDIWKISGHSMAFAAACIILSIVDIRFVPLFLFLPIVAWSRLKLKKHTKMQVVLGILSGVLIPLAIFSAMRIFGYL